MAYRYGRLNTLLGHLVVLVMNWPSDTIQHELMGII